MLMSAHTGKPGADTVYETRWLCNKLCKSGQKEKQGFSEVSHRTCCGFELFNMNSRTERYSESVQRTCRFSWVESLLHPRKWWGIYVILIRPLGFHCKLYKWWTVLETCEHVMKLQFLCCSFCFIFAYCCLKMLYFHCLWPGGDVI